MLFSHDGWVVFFLCPQQRVMIGVAGLLFPTDGTHEQQLVGYSGLDCFLFSFHFLALLFPFFFSVLLSDVNTHFFLAGMNFFLFILMPCIYSRHTQVMLIVYYTFFLS